jgi:hypothetical protein
MAVPVVIYGDYRWVEGKIILNVFGDGNASVGDTVLKILRVTY